MATDFLYLSEEDMIKAGVGNIPACINVCEEVLGLLAQGDYLMGGSTHNSHGMYLVFPETSPFPNMPTAGPDRRFVAMPAYLGGRFNICGNKWYGSNTANKSKGLPRSVLTLTLNDKDTGEPLAFMSANLLSAARTGAVPAVGARYLAKKDSKIISAIGCGPIGAACLKALLTELPQLELVKLHNRSQEKAEKLAQEIEKEFKIRTEVVRSAEEACREADVISIAASRTAPLHIRDEWVRKGAVILLSGPAQCDESLWLDANVIYDHIGLHKAYVREAIDSGDVDRYYSGVIGGPIYRLIDAGKKQGLDESTSIGQIILKNRPGRTGEDERIIYIACGMSVFDLGFGYDILQNAREQGIGTKLRLWDVPVQVQ